MRKHCVLKPFIALLLCASMLFAPMLLSGCEAGENGKDGADGKDGVDGKDGAEWFSGGAVDTFDGGKTGDFYIDKEGYKLYQKSSDGGWTLIMENFGRPGDDGLTPYIGYDGYWWIGNERGDQKFTEILSGNTVESTVGLMENKYFESYALNMGEHSVALMNRYFPTVKKNIYSGMTVKSIRVYAEGAGALTVSTASLSEIAERTAGKSVSLNEIKTFDLKSGLNTLEFNGFCVPEGSTLVLGKSGDTARLAVYKGVGGDDGQGMFADLSGTEIYSQTNGVNDRLVISVEKTSDKEAITGLGNFINGYIPEKTSNEWKPVRLGGPYTHTDITAYAGKTVSHIEVRAHSHTAESTDDVFMTVRVVKQADASLVSTHRFYADPEDITETNEGKILTLTCEDEIHVGDDETLVFASNGDTLLWSYVTDLSYIPLTGGFQTGISIGSSIGSSNSNALLAVNVYLKYTETVNDILKGLEGEEMMEKLKNVLNGKKISIIGDSISTYEGVSNSGSPNSTTKNNNIYYTSKRLALTDTWWKQAIDTYGMELLVNNSFSGSWVTDTRANASGCGSRAENLDSDSGEKPDIIAAYIGVNDLGSGSRPCNQFFDGAFFARVEGGSWTSPYTSGDYTIPTYFDEGYALMIYKIKKDNPNADIFCFTVPESAKQQSALLEKYNKAIRSVAAHYGCSVVELHGTDSESATELSLHYQKYTIDGLHPNAEGMDIITRKFAEALADKYVK